VLSALAQEKQEEETKVVEKSAADYYIDKITQASKNYKLYHK